MRTTWVPIGACAALLFWAMTERHPVAPGKPPPPMCWPPDCGDDAGQDAAPVVEDGGIASVDAAVDANGGADAADQPVMLTRGCGCVAVGAAGAPASGGAVLAVGLAIAVRRRRARRRVG